MIGDHSKGKCLLCNEPYKYCKCEEKLLPCPFCGAKYKEHPDEKYRDVYYIIEHSGDCFLDICHGGSGSLRKIKANLTPWNRRIPAKDEGEKCKICGQPRANHLAGWGEGSRCPTAHADEGEKRKPTIAELEAILDGPDCNIEVLPDGSIRAVQCSSCAEKEKRIEELEAILKAQKTVSQADRIALQAKLESSDAVVEEARITVETYKAYKAECEKNLDSSKARNLIMGFWHSWDKVDAAVAAHDKEEESNA